jgi:Fic family protein
MQNNLHTHLSDLASSFASSVLQAIKGASLEELLGGSRSVERGSPAVRSGSRKATRQSSPGRLPRRSAQDIGKALDGVVTLVKKNKAGLRAEQIRAALGVQSKELPRVLSEGLARKVLKKKGQKRATTYFAA